jgi:thiol-disulfide isomerase/thioredoxin
MKSVHRTARIRGLRPALLSLAGSLLLAAMAQGESAVSAADDASKPFIVKIHADWCGTCTRMNPTFETLQQKYGSQTRIVVLDVTDKESLADAKAEADRLGIREFLDRNKSKTGTVGVLHGASREAVVVMKGETDVAAYEAAISAARKEGAS